MKSTDVSLKKILDVIDALLGPGGCPWDRKQTPLSLCDYVLEESYELVDAIRRGSPSEAREELGDTLFLLLFITALYEKAGNFSLDDVIAENAAKMIRRHPHVFDETEITSQEQLLKNWEAIKRKEKEEHEDQGLFSSLPVGLPPLLKAYRINSKAARVGFTWEHDGQLEEQLHREWQEWLEARASGDVHRQQEEFGDYLFTLAEYARRHSIKPNSALDFANLKFQRRFRAMEALAADRNLSLDAMSLEAMNALWDEVKTEEKGGK